MGKIFILFIAMVLAGVAAEAPNGRQYLPPGQQYGAPFAGGPNALSTQYGVPGRVGGALAGRYAAPGRFAGSLATQYGAPSAFGIGRPSAQYGAPFPGGRFGAPGPVFAPGAPGSAYAPGAPGSVYAPGAPGSVYAPGAPGSIYAPGAPGSGYAPGAPGSGYAPGAPGSVYAPGAGYARRGYNGDFDPLAEPANYEFSYDVIDPPSGNEFGHSESRQGEFAQGRYYVVLPDGRRQVVDYQADQDGFKPQVRYEDSGRGIGYAAGRGGYSY